MSTCLVDTSALLSLLDADDEDHDAVIGSIEQLASDGVALLTTSYTLVESAALVRRRLGQKALRALGDAVDGAMEIVWVDEELHRRAWRRLAAGTRRGPSLVDLVSMLAMDDLGIYQALALDRHFHRPGVTMLP